MASQDEIILLAGGSKNENSWKGTGHLLENYQEGYTISSSSNGAQNNSSNVLNSNLSFLNGTWMNDSSKNKDEYLIFRFPTPVTITSYKMWETKDLHLSYPPIKWELYSLTMFGNMEQFINNDNLDPNFWYDKINNDSLIHQQDCSMNNNTIIRKHTNTNSIIDHEDFHEYEISDQNQRKGNILVMYFPYPFSRINYKLSKEHSTVTIGGLSFYGVKHDQSNNCLLYNGNFDFIKIHEDRYRVMPLKISDISNTYDDFVDIISEQPWYNDIELTNIVTNTVGYIATNLNNNTLNYDYYYDNSFGPLLCYDINTDSLNYKKICSEFNNEFKGPIAKTNFPISASLSHKIIDFTESLLNDDGKSPAVTFNNDVAQQQGIPWVAYQHPTPSGANVAVFNLGIKEFGYENYFSNLRRLHTAGGLGGIYVHKPYTTGDGYIMWKLDASYSYITVEFSVIGDSIHVYGSSSYGGGPGGGPKTNRMVGFVVLCCQSPWSVDNNYDWKVDPSPSFSSVSDVTNNRQIEMVYNSTEKVHQLGKPDRIVYNLGNGPVTKYGKDNASPLINDEFWSKYDVNSTITTTSQTHNEGKSYRLNELVDICNNYKNNRTFGSIDGPSYSNGHFMELTRINILNTKKIYSSSYSDMGLQAGNWMMLLERNSVLSDIKFTLYTGHIDSIKDDIALWTNDINTNNPKDLDLSDNQIIMVSYEDHIVNLTNDTSVNVVNNKYLFNNELSFNYLRKYGLKKQIYYLKGITQDYALRIDCPLDSYITVNSNNVIISNDKNYYYGDNVNVVVSDNFGQASITSINPVVDVKSGEYLFQYNDSDWYQYE